ncbi:hypothetical protein SA286_14690 [Bacillus altitudinis]|uniref:hypothetical protein n=1 Tax=Bacillus altitudinis TaxID=293387 RepID=UPI002D78499A|nr:hypothetical protein [Bacillus altitudinis]WRO25164.1 hypothetical protein SA286_14690 [Bacillus altitudinis]
MEPVKFIKEMLGVAEGGFVDTGVDIVAGVIPHVGQALQSYQINKLKRRLKINENQLSELKDKIESSANELFYKQEVFPLIVKKLMDEDEDSKAKVIIDGFEYIIDNDIFEIERIYHYYDVLSELRYSDIMIFVKKYMPYEMRKETLKASIELIVLENLNKHEQNLYYEKEAIGVYQQNKLIRLGLVESKVANVDGADFNEKGQMSLIEEKIVITDFGIRFLKFFSIEEPDEDFPNN